MIDNRKLTNKIFRWIHYLLSLFQSSNVHVLMSAFCLLSDMERCVLCNESLSDWKPTVKLRAKGSESINKASLSRGSDIETHEGQTVHQECRRVFINPNSIAASMKKPTAETQDPITLKRQLRSEEGKFDFQIDCWLQ